MTFLLPLGLLALLSLPIIFVLHMLRERRRRAVVPSLQHWLNLPRKREGQRRRRIPLSLLLLLHLLVAVLLAFALGRPQLVAALRGPAQDIAIVIDTSTSMAARDGAGTRLDQARQRAEAALGDSNRVILISAGSQARLLANGTSSDDGVQTALANLRAGGTGSDLAGALTLAEAALTDTRSGRILVLTDGTNPPLEHRTASVPIDWQQIGIDKPNRAVVNFAARPAGTKIQVYARVANYADSAFSGQMLLYGNEQRIDSRTVSIDPRNDAELTWELPNNYATLRAELLGDDSLPEDDQARLTVAPGRPTTILVVSQQPDVLQRALSVLPNVQLAQVAEYSQATEQQRAADVTIFDGVLPQAWPAGAALAINPPPELSLLQVGPSASVTGRADLVQQGAVVNGLGFGGVRFDQIRDLRVPEWAHIQLAYGDTALIARGRDGTHDVAIWAFDLHSSNLPTRLAFPLLVSRTVRDLAPGSLPASLQSGANLSLRPSASANSIDLIAPDGGTIQTPISSTLEINTLTQPGWYRVVEKGPNGTVYQGEVAVNAGAPLESDLTAQAAPSFSAPPATAADEQRRNGIDLWPWLALAALVVLALEWGYILR